MPRHSTKFMILELLCFTIVLGNPAEYQIDEVGLTADSFAAAAGFINSDFNHDYDDDYDYGDDDPTTESDGFEGDIVFPEGMDIHSFIKSKGQSGNTTDPDQESAIRSFHRMWDNGVIPYAIPSNLTVRQRNTIAAAILEFSQNTCIKWEKRTKELDYVFFYNAPLGSGCRSMVGKIGWKQTITLGPKCFRKGTVIHEMMHVAGFFHEQSRTDRDEHITVLIENIEPKKRKNFEKYTVEEIDLLGTEYDCNSIMHYGPKAFSRDSATLKTIRGKSPNCDKMGQRNGLSPIDIKDLNLLYECGNKIVDPATTDKLPSHICKELSLQKLGCNTQTMRENCQKTCGITEMGCPDGWKKTRTACYKSLGKKWFTHDSAKSECKKLDSRAILPVFKDGREFEECNNASASFKHTLDNSCRILNDCWVWLGMTYKGPTWLGKTRVEGVWEVTTANGTKCPANVTHWKPGQPDGGGCALHDINKKGYFDFSCLSPKNVICQIRLEEYVC